MNQKCNGNAPFKHLYFEVIWSWHWTVFINRRLCYDKMHLRFKYFLEILNKKYSHRVDYIFIYLHTTVSMFTDMNIIIMLRYKMSLHWQVLVQINYAKKHCTYLI